MAAPTIATPITGHDQYMVTVKIVREAAGAYYTTGEVTMDDATYDALVRAIAEAEETHPQWATADSPTRTVAAGAISGDVTHTTAMLSLDNVFSHEELASWATALENHLGHPVAEYVVEPKLDGLALAARYENGTLTRVVTRGDGTSGEDVTFAAETISGIPRTLADKVTIEVRGEVLLTDKQFIKANNDRIAHGDRPFVNARNGAAGALRGAAGRNYRIELTFFCYGAATLPGGIDVDSMSHIEIINLAAELGVGTLNGSAAHAVVTGSVDEMVDRTDELELHRETLGFAIDGAVVKTNLPADRSAAGASARAPRWGIAYKYPADTAISTLEEVLWQVGRTGVITPRARITPVFVSGTTIEYATLHNVADMRRKGFMVGDSVTVVRAGEVIPRLEAPVVHLRTGSETPIDVPETCPRCGAKIDKSQERWRCIRGRNCGLAESLRYAASRDAWDIEGIGEKIVSGLVEHGLVGDVADLFTLDRAKLSTLDRMADVSTGNILAEIDRARQSSLARTVTALGIRGTGRTMSRRLATHFGAMSALAGATVDDLLQVPGVGSEKATLIAAELTQLKEVIGKLTAAGVAMADATTTAVAKPLTGKTIVVSGKMTGPLAGRSRNEMNELIEQAGGTSSGSVSSKTSLLVTGDSGSSKTAKAEKLGVPVVTPDEFAAMLG